MKLVDAELVEQGIKKGIEALLNSITDIDVVEYGEWISIEDERKPKNLHEYLCLCSFENSTPEEHCWVMTLKWHAFEGNGVVDRPHFTDEGVEGMRVTHWMELPPPPKGIKRYR